MRKKRIFISCGQRTSQEKIFGKEVQTLINQHMDGFFAEEAHDAADLNTSLFRELQNCDGFVAVMQKRGNVNYSDSPTHYRFCMDSTRNCDSPLQIFSVGATNSDAALFRERNSTRRLDSVLND